MNYLRKTFLCVALLLGAGLISTVVTACSGSAEADSGVTLQQFNALKAQVTSQASTISDMKAQIQANAAAVASAAKVGKLYLTISAPNAHTASMHAESYGASSSGPRPLAETGCTGLGTLTGHPNTSDPISSNVLSGYSCTGYLFNVSGSVAGGVSHVQPLASSIELDFTAANCTGSMYVRNVPEAAIASGIVFSFNASGVIDYTNASNYYYVPAGQTQEQVAMVSIYNGSCQNLDSGGTILKAWPVSPNDPAVTAIDSAEIAGPVMAATP